MSTAMVIAMAMAMGSAMATTPAPTLSPLARRGLPLPSLHLPILPSSSRHLHPLLRSFSQRPPGSEGIPLPSDGASLYRRGRHCSSTSHCRGAHPSAGDEEGDGGDDGIGGGRQETSPRRGRRSRLTQKWRSDLGSLEASPRSGRRRSHATKKDHGEVEAYSPFHDVDSHGDGNGDGDGHGVGDGDHTCTNPFTALSPWPPSSIPPPPYPSLLLPPPLSPPKVLLSKAVWVRGHPFGV